ncbi:MAG: ABC transporter ATP-binding protein [Thiohalocapsa sp.]
MPLVDMSRVSKRFISAGAPVEALREVSLQIEAGEFIAVVGRSGSGKSTLMSLLGLLDRPDGGSYQLHGHDVATLPDDRRSTLRSGEIGFVFQQPMLLPRSTALQNVELPLAYAGVRRRDRRQRALAALERVGLGHRLGHWPNQLSGGEQQRVAIARALVNNPSLILADEPTGALDSVTGESILAIFRELNSEGRTILVVTHAGDVAAHAVRRITLHDGRITGDDRTARGDPAGDPRGDPGGDR